MSFLLISLLLKEAEEEGIATEEISRTSSSSVDLLKSFAKLQKKNGGDLRAAMEYLGETLTLNY